MGEFKHFDGGEPFLQPERPFLLIYEDENEDVSFSFLQTEEDIIEVIKEVKSYGCKILQAIEIGSCRDVVADNIYGLYKKIAKRDPKAIDEIKTLEEAKEIIKMLVGSAHGIKTDNSLYPMDFDKAVEVVAENSHRWNGNGI